MKKMVLSSVGTLCLLAISMAGPVLAAELLDVKPVISGSNVVIEVTADIPMTYTYYKVPGQARAVVDIADADPEKVEPLIVVNVGSLASISVDKAMISDMTVSRLVFNLVAESEISVKQTSDRKMLTVSFGGNKSPAVVQPVPVVNPASAMVATPVVADRPVVAPEPEKTVAAVASLIKEEEDPLGLDEPTTAPLSAPVVAVVDARSVLQDPAVQSSSVPVQSKAVVKGIVIGSSFIDIQVNGNVDKIKHVKLDQPDRLAIDIPGKSTMTKKTVSINKFGIAKVRIGNTPGVVRIVLDAKKSPFPSYSVDFTDTGVRVNFK